MRFPFGLFSVACAMTIVLACGSDSTGPGLPSGGSIDVNPDSLSLVQQGTAHLEVAVLDKDGTLLSGIPVKFVSLDTTRIRVSTTGDVTSVGPAGLTGLEVRAGGLKKAVPVVVTSVAMAITLSPNPAAVAQNQSLQMTGVVTDLVGAPIPDAPITYRSSDPAVATVSSSGLVTSVGPAGAIQIQAQSGSLTTSAAVAVTPVPTSLHVFPSILTVASGRTGQIEVTVRDAVGVPIAGLPLTFTSADVAIATVSPAGLVTSVGPFGQTRVLVDAAGLRDSVTVDVVPISHPQGVLAGTTPQLPSSPYSVGVATTGIVYAGTLSGDVYRSDITAFGASVVRPGNGEFIWGIAFGPSGSTAFVSGYPTDGVSRIDVATGTITASVSGLVGTPFGLVSSPTGQSLYVSTDGDIYQLDPATLSVTGHASTGATGIHLAIHPSLPLLYVSDQGQARVVEVSATNLTTVRTFNSLGTTQAAGVSPDGAHLYVADENGYLHVVDLGTGVSTPYALPCSAWGLAVAKDGTEVYIGCPGSDRIQVFDTASMSLTGSIVVGFGARRLALSPDGSVLAVALESGQVAFVK